MAPADVWTDPLVRRAAALAAELHAGDVRKGSDQPYFEGHLEPVARLVAEAGGTPVQVAAAYLHDAAEDPTAVKRFADRMLIESDRLAQLVQQIIELSRLQADDPLEAPSAVDLDEVITVAAGFPTTVNPIVQNGLVPVFVDIELGTYNTTPDRVAAAIGPRTKAIMMAHSLGNPFAAREIAELAEQPYHRFLPRTPRPKGIPGSGHVSKV